MARKRKPPNLAVDFLVQHPESEVERRWPRDADGEIDEPLDTDGHAISFQVVIWRGEALAGGAKPWPA